MVDNRSLTVKSLKLVDSWGTQVKKYTSGLVNLLSVTQTGAVILATMATLLLATRRTVEKCHKYNFHGGQEHRKDDVVVVAVAIIRYGLRTHKHKLGNIGCTRALEMYRCRSATNA